MFKKLIITLALLLLPALAFAEIYTVERVIDGNTLKLTNGETVCLIGIDCPEIDAEEGKEATEFMEQIISHLDKQEIVLEFDVEKRDKYGRLLAYIFHNTGMEEGYDYNVPASAMYHTVVKEDGWVYAFINAAMIEHGYASPMTIPPNVKYAELFQKLYQEAREHKRGLWKGVEYSIYKFCESNDDCVVIRDFCGCEDLCLNKSTKLDHCFPEGSECQFPEDTQICLCENNQCAESNAVDVNQGLSPEFLLSVAADTTVQDCFRAIKDKQGELFNKKFVEIPEEFWAERIRDLKPIKVYTVENSHLVVVQSIVDGVEEGKYIHLGYASKLGFTCGSYGFICTQGKSWGGDFKRAPNNNLGVGGKCISKEECMSIDCSYYDNPSKEGYKPYCEDGKCKCMCYGCE